jgi:hypothetical protein
MAPTNKEMAALLFVKHPKLASELLTQLLRKPRPPRSRTPTHPPPHLSRETEVRQIFFKTICDNIAKRKHGVACRAGALLAIALGIPPHFCPRQGRQRPAPRFYAAGAGGVTKVETCTSGSAPAA